VGVLKMIVALLRGLLASRSALMAENVALRQQLGVLRRSVKRPRLRRRDRVFWVWLSRLWRNWRSCLIVVKPATVVRWHRQGFRLYWRWKSRSNKAGRPSLDAEVRQLIRRMCRENSLWGAPRIQSELALLGYTVAESTVAQYMVRGRKPPSQTWRTFLENHVGCLASIDFFTVPTATFRVLYVFVVLRHNRRRVVHFNVTAHPTAAWTSRQIVQAFPYEEAPRFLIRDRDKIYGDVVRRCIQSRSIEEVLIAPRSPWQSPYVERLIGSIRRECLDHVIVFGEDHLRRVLDSYFAYYHESRTHLSLDRNAPERRDIEPPSRGEVIAIPQVGGLHHRYTRAA
jgi:putative transposase